MGRKSVEREIQSDKEMGVERKDVGGKRKRRKKEKRERQAICNKLCNERSKTMEWKND